MAALVVVGAVAPAGGRPDAGGPASYHGRWRPVKLNVAVTRPSQARAAFNLYVLNKFQA